MDENVLTEMRNYLTAAGLFIIALGLPIVIDTMVSGKYNPGLMTVFIGLGLVIVGILLAVCRKRDLSAITFLMMGLWYLWKFFEFIPNMSAAETTAIAPSLNGIVSSSIFGIILVILALVILTSKDKKKYVLSIVPGLYGIGIIALSVSKSLGMIFETIAMIIALYLAIAVASERINLPLGKIMKSDVTTDFKSSGSVLGYLLFAISTLGYFIYYLSGNALIYSSLLYTDIIVGLMLILTGIILFTIGKMRFTSVMFILLGFSTLAAPLSASGLPFVILGIMIFVIGLMAVLRYESRILPGIMLMIYSVSAIIVGLGITIPILCGLLNLIPCLIAIYLAFAVFSQSKKLKLF